jgi:hypothetical protein
MTDVGTVTIAGDTRNLSDVDESWVTQQVNRRRRDGLAVCVVVKVETTGLNMTLATSACVGSGGGGGRLPNPREQDVFDMWNSLRLNTSDFTGGNLVAFLKQLRRLF